MPCSDGGPIDRYYEDPETLKRLDKATKLLCSLCKKLEDGKDINDEEFVNNRELFYWWKNHKKEDVKRTEKELEEKKKEILKKLTAEEKKILGIKI